MDINETLDKLWALVILYTPKIVLAILTLIIGLWLIGKIVKWARSAMTGRFDDTVIKFLTSLIGVGLKILLLFSIAAKLGIDTTSFVAIFAALMVGVGMALNGTIGHFASGVMLMIFRPFKVGDLVEIGGGKVGTVEGINAFNTTLLTLDNKLIIIANSHVTDNIITNISGQGIVGVELAFKIGLNEDIDTARNIILGVGQKCPYVLDDPAQAVVVSSIDSNGINLASRPFCKSENYWDTLFYMNEEVKKQMDAAQVKVPYPQMELHMKQAMN